MSAEMAVETRGLTKRYGQRAALLDCTIEVPDGSICALVGANGAGKTTLLETLAGLRAPTSGVALVDGQPPRQDPAFLAEIGFLAQEIPLYRRFTADDHIDIGAHLNPRWDTASARARLQALDIALDQRVGTLSGGQRAQVALALALAKRPRLLLLDEPVAALDPLARRGFLSVLAEAVADGGLTVILSSHLIGDLERICDHVVLLAAGRPLLCGAIDEVLAEHTVLTGPRFDTAAIERDHVVVQTISTQRQITMIVRTNGPLVDPRWDAHPVGFEELLLAYMADGEPALAHPLRAVG
jgi:ABC-2 type transport system ATP-binding protein